MSALAGDLGQHGIWVDQLTTLDPCPVGPDARVSLGNNIVFADNYYENALVGDLPLQGPITGAANNGPYSASASQGLSLGGAYGLLAGYQHSDVHLFYQGTINPSTSGYDGSYHVDWSWFPLSGGLDPNTTGFYYSLIEGGARPSVGLSTLFAGTGSRSPMTTSGDQWADIGYISVPASAYTGVQVGNALTVDYSVETRDSGATINWCLGPVSNYQNPSSSDITLGSSPAPSTGGAVDTGNATLDTSQVTAGQYYLYATITDDGQTRVAYAPGAFYFTSAPPPAPSVPQITCVTPTSLPGLSLPQTQLLTIDGSGFTIDLGPAIL